MQRIVLVNLRGMSDSQIQYIRDLLESELSNNPRFSDVTILVSEKTYKPLVVDTDVYDEFEKRISAKTPKQGEAIRINDDGTKIQTQ